MKKIFQFSALAIAVSLSTMAAAQTTISDTHNVSIFVDSDMNNAGDFQVFSGVTQLIYSNISGTGFTTNVGIGGNLGVGGSLTVNSPAGISTAKITLNGQDLATTIASGDTATLNSAKSYTDTKVVSEAASRTAADAALDTRIDNETAARATADIMLNTRVDNETAVRAAADTALNGRVDTEIAARQAAVTAEATARATADTTLQNNINAEAATRAAAITAEANARTAGDAATLSSAKGYTDTKTAATLVSANAYTDGRANQLNSRIDDVQKTAYRGIAISLAAQQAVPSIQPGQVALFGGVGHYEGETAGSIGVVTAFTDRLSASGAFGFAGGNEFGGRVGVAYVFGGK